MAVVEEVRLAKDFHKSVFRQDKRGPDLSPLVSVLSVLVTIVGGNTLVN